MAKTISELLFILEERTKKTSDSSAHKVYLRSELDLAIRYHTNISYNWNELYVESSLSGTEDGNEFLAGSDIDSIQYIWHELNNKKAPIELVNKDIFYQKYLSTTSTDDPVIAIISKISPIYNSITTPRVLTISSSNSADVNIPVRIYGLVNGSPAYETITTNSSNGTTSASGSKAFSDIYSIAKNGETTGEITIYSVPTTLAVLPSGVLSAEVRYTYLKFYPILAQDMTIYFLKKRKQYKINMDNDFMILSDNHDDAILKLAEYNIYKNNSMLKDYKRLRKDLIYQEPFFGQNNPLQNSFQSQTIRSNLGSDYGI